jgi:prophage maintenance system killer protein
LFLEMNGMRFTALEVAATRAVLDLASGALSVRGYAAFMRGIM